MNKLIYLCFMLLFSCGQKINDKKNAANYISIDNNDSIVKAVFNFGKQYFEIRNIDSVLAKYGNPINSYKTQWCGGICDDSLLTSFEYSNLTLHFFEHDSSNIEFESISYFDKKNSLPANLIIGKTTRQDILQSLGLPDKEHNELGRTLVDGTQSNAKDTVILVYSIDIDEYAISLSMTKDTLRKINWTKNMN